MDWHSLPRRCKGTKIIEHTARLCNFFTYHFSLITFFRNFATNL